MWARLINPLGTSGAVNSNCGSPPLRLVADEWLGLCEKATPFRHCGQIRAVPADIVADKPIRCPATDREGMIPQYRCEVVPLLATIKCEL